MQGRRLMEAPPLVLLVDDIPDHAKRYESAMRQHGYRVHLVHTGVAALALAQGEVPSCVVIDVRLPDITGWELCRSMKADPRLKHVPVVILTSDVTRTAAGDSENAGCSAWLAHPASPHDVTRVVEYVLAQSRPSPLSPDEAIVGVSRCEACGSDRIRATLRLGTVQYFACQSCRFSWRRDSKEIVA
jgi:CheY-like chemotaxis protein